LNIVFRRNVDSTAVIRRRFSPSRKWSLSADEGGEGHSGRVKPKEFPNRASQNPNNIPTFCRMLECFTKLFISFYAKIFILKNTNKGGPVVNLKKLRNFNLVMAFLHALQGVAIILLSRDFTLPITLGFLDFNVQTQKLIPASETIFDLPLSWLIVGFLFLSSFFHLAISTFYNKKYNEGLEKGINKLRWVEYSFSASTMMVAISMLVGIYDLGMLLMIFALVAIMNLMGLMMEVHNQTTKKTNWLSYKIGVFAGATPWIVVALFFLAASKYGAGDIPTFVYYIYVSIFAFFNIFALNMILQYKKIGPWKDYLFGEKVYVILSLLAKSALAWQVFAGTLQPV